MTTYDDQWRDEALCAQTDPEIFFPNKGQSGFIKPAKKICFACPVRLACLQDALDHDERFGIWGGLTERERRRYRHGTSLWKILGNGRPA